MCVFVCPPPHPTLLVVPLCCGICITNRSRAGPPLLNPHGLSRSSRPVSIRTLPPANPDFNNEGLARFRLVNREGAGPAPPNCPPCDEWRFQEATKHRLRSGPVIISTWKLRLNKLAGFLCSREEIKNFFFPAPSRCHVDAPLLPHCTCFPQTDP